MNDRQPCCAADALRRIRKIPVNGVMTGINGLDESIAAVRAMNLGSESAIRAALLEKVRDGNYIPLPVEEAYAIALMEEYRKESGRRCGCGCRDSPGS
ncbi:MAG TPA: hypothetical protein VHN82_05195 [Methanoregula sp.]|nr:hypothetical protein [Methanoregula sp.]